MKASPSALTAIITAAITSSAIVDAFTPYSLLVQRTTVRSGTTWYSSDAGLLSSSTTAQLQYSRRNRTTLEMAGFLGMDDDDEDEDDEDEDDEDDDDDEDSPRRSRYTSAVSPFSGMKLDPWDPNIPIKPRPGKYGFKNEEETIPDDQLVQTMTAEERRENLEVMRQIKKSDLPDLLTRKDHAGWVEANNELKRRTKKDPWFGLNERLTEAAQLGDDEEVKYLNELIKKLGGPPPQIKIGPRGYARHSEIFDIGMSQARAASMLEREIRAERAARGRAMAAEFRKNQEKEMREWEERLRNPGDKEYKEAKERRERTMRRLLAEIEEDRKKRRERAKELLGKLPEIPESTTESLDQAIKASREDVKRLRKMRKEGEGLGRISGEGGSALSGGGGDKPKGAAARAREAAAAESAGGRPRLPGDPDVTRGDIEIPIESSSTTITGPLQVEVSSTYNKEQSDPPMRKHCFQYTIRITNNSETDTVQLLSRRFEIQTVGSSMKDVVQGEGVTGRQPILKPGEVFEYTSTAPLSVRPLGTTVIAARMRGEYRYVVLKNGQETATPEQVKEGGDTSAELGMFHFVFPEEQRVKPVRPLEDDEDEDDEEDDEDAASSMSTKRASSSTSTAAAATTGAARPVSSTTSATPASTLPGDADVKTGDITIPIADASDTVTDGVRVQVNSSYRPERSDAALEKHCFAYNIRITNESSKNIQLVSRRFEIQTIGSTNKDVVQGPGVTGRQPILKPGESFEYTSTAPLSVRPMLEKTPVVARMEGAYNFVILGEDGTTPISSTPLQAKLGMFHFVLPALDVA